MKSVLDKVFTSVKGFFSELKLYPNNRYNDKEVKGSTKGKKVVNWIAKFLWLMSMFFLQLSLWFNTFRVSLKEIFNPSVNAKRNWRLWVGSFFRIMTILLIISGIAPLMLNSLMPEWQLITYICVVLIAFQYFMKWFTCDLKGDWYFHEKIPKLLLFPFKLGNILYLAIWLVPLILLLMYPYDSDIVGNSTILPSFAKNLGSVIWLILLMFSLTIYNEVQYLGFSKGLLVLNYVFEKNSKIITTLIIALLVMVLIFSVIVMNVEALAWNQDYETTNGGKSKLLSDDGFTGWFNSFYMCFITFTTIGFGDVTPVTEPAKIVIMISAIFGVAFYSLFTSIIVNGFIQYLDNVKEQEIERKDRMFREAIKELDVELQEKKISKSIYELKVRKIKEDLKNNNTNKKKIKLSTIKKQNLKVHGRRKKEK